MNRRNFLRRSSEGVAALAGTAALPRRVLGANDRIRIGIVGCGSRGNFLMEQVLRSATAQNVEVTALCDVWSVNLERTAATLAERTGGTRPQTFKRYRELLERGGVDAIIIATPDFAHTPVLIDATQMRKDVFVEKPMATVLDQANQAVRDVQRNNTIVQVGVQRRSDRRHQAGAQLVQSGILGTISEVEAAWHDATPRWARDYSNVRREDVDWEQYLMYLPREPFRPERFRRWHLYKDFTQGTPALLGAHLIDVAVWFMDDPLPHSAVAHGGVYVWKDGREHADTLDCVFEYPKGFLLNYSTRLGNRKPIPEVTFFGSKGSFDTRNWTASGEGGGEGAIATPVTVPDPRQAVAAASDGSNGGGGATNGSTNALAQAQNDPRIAGDGHMINWLECLRTRQQPTAPVETGYAHTLASIMAFQAWTTGRRQVFNPATRTIRAG